MRNWGILILFAVVGATAFSRAEAQAVSNFGLFKSICVDGDGDVLAARKAALKAGFRPANVSSYTPPAGSKTLLMLERRSDDGLSTQQLVISTAVQDDPVPTAILACNLRITPADPMLTTAFWEWAPVSPFLATATMVALQYERTENGVAPTPEDGDIASLVRSGRHRAVFLTEAGYGSLLTYLRFGPDR